MVSNKGKEVAGKYSGKGKRPAADPDKTSGPKRKRNRGVVQFFDDAAYEVDDDDDEEDDVSDLGDFGDWDFYEDDFEAQPSKVNSESGKAHNVPVLPKEEELSEEELEKFAQERYRPGSNNVTYADDRLRTRNAVYENDGGNEGLPSYKEPTIWKVKCMIGREKQSVFCLMQKYVELKSLGNKLHIISAIFIEHIKGFIYIEAERQSDINEACRGVSTIYSSRLAPVPKNEVSSSLSVRSKGNEVSVGSWARVKNGIYRGDLAQVIAVNDSRKKATVKLIPRIDLQVLAEKYGGGVAPKKRAIPAPRLVTSTELEEFRPLIQYRRDRESGLAFDVLDGMMLKDGYLYKKVLIDSLNLYGVLPSEEERLKFESSKNEAPDCHAWLTELYGEKKKEPRVVKNDKGGGGKGDGGKGEGSSSASVENSFEVNDLVLFNKKDFGVIVGLEKEEYYKVLKEGTEGPLVLTVDMRQLKKASFENRFTALDKHKKILSINDNVRVLEGPLEGRQGNVKHIYRGIIFLHDEIEQENNGYFCCKSQICEKIKISNDASKGKDGESSFPAFDDPPSSPKSPLADQKPWETRERNSSFNREDQEGFTVGQSLRIRVGPLKGYLCRVLAIRRTDITVKLDSQHKILTVKTEHLAEVRGRSSAIPMSDDKDAKPFDMLGNPDGSADWMTGAGTSADGERGSWPAFPSSGTAASAMETDTKDEGGGGWGSKVTPKPSSAWGSTATDEKPVADNEQAGGWGNSGGNWGNNNKSKTSTEDQAGSSQGAGGWGNTGGGNWGNNNKSKISAENEGASSQDAGGSWGSKPNTATPSNGDNSTWGNKSKTSIEDGAGSSQSAGGWGNSSGGNWGNNNKSKISIGNDGASSQDAGSNWGSKPNTATPLNDDTSSWGNKVAKPTTEITEWGNNNNKLKISIGNDGASSQDAGSNWGSKPNTATPLNDDTSSWGNKVAKPTTEITEWGNNNNKLKISAENDGASSQDAGANWGSKPKTVTPSNDDTSSWGNKVAKPAAQITVWGKSASENRSPDENKIDNKKDDTSSGWGNRPNVDGGQGGIWEKNKTKQDSASVWGKKVESSDGGESGSWGKSDAKKIDCAPAWGKKVESSDRGETGSWGKTDAKKIDSAPAWGKKVEYSDGGETGSWGKSDAKKINSGPSWGKKDESSDGNSAKGSEDGSWGNKASKSWGNKDDSSNKKPAWNSSASGEGGGGWRSGGGSSWGNNKQNDENNEDGRGGGFGGRRGGERIGGRGGFRGRGRSDFGGGGGGGGYGGRGRGRRDENSDFGNNQNDAGGKSWSSGGGGGGSSGTGGNWNKCGSEDGGQPSILGKPKEANIGSGVGSGWGNKSGPSDGAQSSGWGAPKGSDGEGGSSGSWGKPASGGGSWGKGGDSSGGGSKGGW